MGPTAPTLTTNFAVMRTLLHLTAITRSKRAIRSLILVTMYPALDSDLRPDPVIMTEIG